MMDAWDKSALWLSGVCTGIGALFMVASVQCYTREGDSKWITYTRDDIVQFGALTILFIGLARFFKWVSE